MIHLLSALALLLLATTTPARATDSLPVSGSGARPALLLDLGAEPGVAQRGVRVFAGTANDADADSSIGVERDAVVARHPGFGRWSNSFRFTLTAAPPAGPYTFWARWRQGGEPGVCVQDFELWAGTDPAHLERRAVWPLQPKGWDYAWIAAEPPLALRRGDKLVEIRVAGAGHDAKVFDAFLLGPPPPATPLPVRPGKGQPVLLLELGRAPRRAKAVAEPGLRVVTGALAEPRGGGRIDEDDEIQVLHPGFGEFGAAFRFPLTPPPAPGRYRFFARYKSGGEVSQVQQRFSVRLGGASDRLAERASFTLTNTTPWEYQWLEGEGTFPILPGDRLLHIDDHGKADGAKVFDAFLVQRVGAIPGAMSAADADARNRFLAAVHPLEHPRQRLYVLDDGSPAGRVLFDGLASEAALRQLGETEVVSLLGEDAATVAAALHLQHLPALAATDDRYSLLGVLMKPADPGAVANFLADPRRLGSLPEIAGAGDEPAQPLRNGIPPAWLVGGLQDGVAGVSIFALDAETVLRPNPGEPYLGTELAGGRMRAWQAAPTDRAGSAAIAAATEHDYRWAGGSGYAHLYLQAERLTPARLSWNEADGVEGIWLDGGAVPATASGAELALGPGWHSLLLKRVMHLDRGQRFAVAARFLDRDGRPLEKLQVRLSDPAADLAAAAVASRLRPQVYVDAPANLPRPGEPLRLRVDLRWHELEQERTLVGPLPAFAARLRVEIRDYRGHTLALREHDGIYPAVADLDFGSAPAPGYYAVHTALYRPDGRLIKSYPADGFSVVGGNAAQRQRLSEKKLWNNYYYAFADGDRGFGRNGGYFDWLERSAVFRSYGGYPGFEPARQAAWEEATRRGLVFFGDTGGDSHWLGDDEAGGNQVIGRISAYTRYFKAGNEIDIRSGGDWSRLREPAHWLGRARREFETIHRARPDGHYVGASLVKPGDLGDNGGYPGGLGPGRWFEAVLGLGLDQYLDAWDVHVYPQRPPRFGAPLGNGEAEDERGVLATYARLGRRNPLPFWLGETGAKAAHGSSGRRWQAEQTAKMIAWVNSRPDYLGIAFCLGHEYDLGQGRIWDYSMGHKPGEAALYTAGALIDGLPYRPHDGADPQLQAAWFGPSLMAWRSDTERRPWTLPLEAGRRWIRVDVVGNAEILPLAADGTATLELDQSPVYLVPEDEYRRLLGL